MTGYIYSRWLTPTLQLSEVCCYCKSVIPLEMCLFAVFGEMSVFLCQNKKSAWEAETEHYKIIPSGRWAASLGSHFRLSTVQPSSAQITSVYEWVCVCVCLLYFQRYIQWSQNSNSKDNVHCTLPAYFLKHSKLKINLLFKRTRASKCQCQASSTQQQTNWFKKHGYMFAECCGGVQVCVLVCVSSPGGVYASMEVCTTSERLLEGIGTATFLSTCRANTACTASVWTSDRHRERFIHTKAEEETYLTEWELQRLVDGLLWGLWTVLRR